MTPELLFGKDGNSGFYGAVVDYLKNNKAMQESLMKATNNSHLLDPANEQLAEIFVNQRVPDILRGLFTSPL